MPLKIPNPSYCFIFFCYLQNKFSKFFLFFLMYPCIFRLQLGMILLKVFVIQIWIKDNHFHFNTQERQVYEHA